jgi:hypothetical protein
MLQQQQGIIQKLVDGIMRDDADDATHGALLETGPTDFKKLKNSHAATWPQATMV